MLAIIFGLIARRQIKERNESGDGMAIAGLVLGILGVIGAIILIIVVATVVDDIDDFEEFEDFQMIRVAASWAVEKVASAVGGVRGLLAGLV